MTFQPKWIQPELPFDPPLPKDYSAESTSPLRSASRSAQVLESLVQELEAQIRAMQHALAELKRGS